MKLSLGSYDLWHNNITLGVLTFTKAQHLKSLKKFLDPDYDVDHHKNKQ